MVKKLSKLGQVRKRPELVPLLDRLSQVLPAGTLDSVEKAFGTRRNTTFRLNTLKCDNEFETMQSLDDWIQTLPKSKKGAKAVRCPWARNAFTVSDASIGVKHLIDCPAHKAGKIHFQSLSSMIPPLCMSVKPGGRALDMCAAPGGKTAMIAELMGGRGQLVANELDRERFDKLRFIVSCLLPDEKLPMVDFRCVDGRKLTLVPPISTQDSELQSFAQDASDLGTAKSPETSTHSTALSGTFDAILLDAPCPHPTLLASLTALLHLHDPSDLAADAVCYFRQRRRNHLNLESGKLPTLVAWLGQKTRGVAT
eukprot:1163974-Rhodomonas_salina.1